MKPNKNEKQAKRQKSRLRRILEPIVLALAAILCFTYTVASTLWNNKVSKEISVAYDRLSRKQTASAREKILNAARRYNARHKSIITADPYDGTTDYMRRQSIRSMRSSWMSQWGLWES